jgi:predicted Rossmann fold nucleotide-binding protein DprA/Smf involved in DNA uptake
MATPLNKVYPAENRQLANDILDSGGCWISELPLWGKFHKSSFVQRDRIQSGLSVAVVPVQTDVEGGTMHTVRYAEQQGRLLLCPRPIETEQSLRQYAGVRQLLESKRAVPFSSNEYATVLQSLLECRNHLLNASPTERTSENKTPDHTSEDAGTRINIAAKLEEQPSSEAAPVPEQKPKRKKQQRLQVDFDFIKELPASKPKKPSTKRAKESQIRLLEQLRDEIYDARRPDGGRISSADDLQVWLDEKIRTLRNQS